MNERVTTMEDTFFGLSFADWQKRTGGSLEDWRAESAELWAAMRANPHWHGGVPCREVAACRRSRPGASGVAAS